MVPVLSTVKLPAGFPLRPTPVSAPAKTPLLFTVTPAPVAEVVQTTAQSRLDTVILPP